jgi:hypothetical protein
MRAHILLLPAPPLRTWSKLREIRIQLNPMATKSHVKRQKKDSQQRKPVIGQKKSRNQKKPEGKTRKKPPRI